MPAPIGNKNAEGNNGGAPTLYKSEYNEQAYKLCLLGATDAEIADFFGVCEKTINNWKEEHVEFLQSLKSGKVQADMEIVNSLFNKAKGFEMKTQKAFKVRKQVNGEGSEENIVMVDVIETVPPDTTAAIFWLKNRQKHNWRDRQEVDHTTNGKAIKHINLGGGVEPEED